jgi:hypothetical protein
MIDPKNTDYPQQNISFDKRKYPADKLKLEIAQQVADMQKFINQRRPGFTIQITIGGKPINVKQEFDESVELSSILKNAGLKN